MLVTSAQRELSHQATPLSVVCPVALDSPVLWVPRMNGTATLWTNALLAQVGLCRVIEGKLCHIGRSLIQHQLGGW